MEEYAVELRQVSKIFRETRAVEGIDLKIEKGEFFSLLGPSGCGKTTTLRLIAGFEAPSDGEVWIAGQAVQDLPAYRRNVNTVFQQYSLFPHLNVFDNIAFGLRRARVGEDEIARRVKDSLELVQLVDFGDRRVQQLSGGQQQRIALARALVNRPAVLLLDEPMAALDAKLRKDMRIELKRLQKSVGITFVLVTHDQEEALTLSDRLAVLHRGRLEQVSSPREIYERPASRFVAEFMGAANFLPVKIGASQGERIQLEGPAPGLFTTLPLAPGLTSGTLAEMTLRPERCLLSEQSRDHNCLEVTLEERFFVGPITRFVVRLQPSTSFLVERPTDEEHSFEPGQRLFLTWEADAAHLLAMAPR